MKLRSQDHVNEDESKEFNYSKRRKSARAYEKKDSNRPLDNPTPC